MKKLTFLVVLAFLFSMIQIQAQEFEGIEAGDKELSFNGMVMAQSGFALGSIFLSGGYYISDRLLVGAAPGVTIFGGGGFGQTTLSLSLFSTYNFMTDKSNFPYVKAALVQQAFQSPFLSFTSIQAGGGYKVFFTDKIAWDTSVTLGFTLSPVTFSTLILTGLSFML